VARVWTELRVVEQETVERPDQRRPRGTRRILTVIAVAAALALVLVLALIWLFPGDPAETPTAAGGPSGSDQFGSAPGTGRTASAGSRSPSPGTSPTATASAGPADSPGPVAGVDLRATYQVTKGLANSTVSVRITNEGTATADGWSVIMKVSGVPLSVKPGPGVTYQGSGSELTFSAPEADRAVAPGDVVGFTFTVTGVLGKVQSCTISGRACTAA